MSCSRDEIPGAVSICHTTATHLSYPQALTRMQRVWPLALLFLGATAAGCVSPEPSSVWIEGMGCPSEALEGDDTQTVSVPGRATDLVVDPDGTVYVITRSCLHIISADLESVASWSLPEVGTWRKMTVAATAERVYVAHFPVDEPIDPTTYEGRGVLAFDKDGRRTASWEVAQVRALLTLADGALVVLHDAARENRATVLDPALNVLDTFTFPQDGHGVRDGAHDDGSLFWLDSTDHGASRVVVTDSSGEFLREFPSGIEPTGIAVGHGLVIISATAYGGSTLRIHDTDGELLMTRETDGSYDSFGMFEIAHGNVYNFQDEHITVRSIAEFMADPPGDPA